MTSPREFFEGTECRDWEELISQLEELEVGWLFLGERNSEWDLSTSLERHTPNPLQTRRRRVDAFWQQSG